MRLGVRVAREKKSGGKPDEEKVSEPVKLRPTFKKRLQRVAEDAGIDMGMLIEQQMKAFIDREFKRLVEQELKELRDEA